MMVKRLLSLSISLVLIFTLFAGCAPAKKPIDTPTDKPVDKPTDENIKTDIVFAEVADVSSTDPQDQTDVYSAAVCLMMYETLFKFDDDVNLLPGLAKKWEVVSPTKYKIFLEEGVKFHNGDILKASDVKFSIERMAKMPKSMVLYQSIIKVDVVSDYVLTFETDLPMAPILLNLAGPQACIVNEKVVTEAEASGVKYGSGAIKPIGTGPMEFKEWKINDVFTVVRNEEYWKGPVKATSISARVIPEAGSRTIALEMGEVDFIAAVNPIDAQRVFDNKDLKTVEQPGTSISYMGMNQAKPPLDNKKLRQAINLGINKQAIVDVVLEGQGIVVNSVFQTMMPSYDETLNLYPYNEEKAKAKLIEAGFPDGVKLVIGVSSGTTDRVAQLVQADLGKIGITIDIMMQEFGAFLQYLGGKEHDMFILGWSNSYNPDRTMSIMFHSESGGAMGNRMWYNNPEADKLIESAKKELVWEKREPMYVELQQMIMDDAIWVPLYQTMQVIGMKKGLEGTIISKLTPFHDHTNAYVVE